MKQGGSATHRGSCLAGLQGQVLRSCDPNSQKSLLPVTVNKSPRIVLEEGRGYEHPQSIISFRKPHQLGTKSSSICAYGRGFSPKTARTKCVSTDSRGSEPSCQALLLVLYGVQHAKHTVHMLCGQNQVAMESHDAT